MSKRRDGSYGEMYQSRKSMDVTDKLKLNEGKTEFMIIGTRQQLKKVTIDQLLVGDMRVIPVSNVKDLGVWLDSHLKFDVHITKTCSTAYYFLHNIRRIRKYLTHHTTQILVHAQVIGRIDYCMQFFVLWSSKNSDEEIAKSTEHGR